MKKITNGASLLILANVICFSTFAQQKVFTAPASADGMQNPFKDNAAATANGKTTYTTFCVPCHGDKGKGDGVAAAGLQKQPADHTSAKIQAQTDGALFWKIFTGNNPMPSYKMLSQTQIWELVNYIRTLSKAKKK